MHKKMILAVGEGGAAKELLPGRSPRYDRVISTLPLWSSTKIAEIPDIV
jgi:hypothetical protein